MMERIAEIARITRDDYGVSSSLHAHGGCYIEFEDEIDRAMDDLSPDLVGLCVDTGHSAYAGIDRVGLIRRYGSRVFHMHLQGHRSGRAGRLRCRRHRLLQRCRPRHLLSARRGMVDFAAACAMRLATSAMVA